MRRYGSLIKINPSGIVEENEKKSKLAKFVSAIGFLSFLARKPRLKRERSLIATALLLPIQGVQYNVWFLTILLQHLIATALKQTLLLLMMMIQGVPYNVWFLTILPYYFSILLQQHCCCRYRVFHIMCDF